MARRRWDAGQMRELVSECEQSAMSLGAFAEAVEVPASTLSWWRARLRAESPSTRFVPVHVAELQCEEEAQRGCDVEVEHAEREQRVGSVEIVVGDVVVRMADAGVVARLVRAIASC